MLISEFDFQLPDSLIAQVPLNDRSSSRMLNVNREEESYSDNSFQNFPDSIREGDLVVVNNTKVFPARIKGISETGSKIELFLVSELKSKTWKTLARPARRLRIGKRIEFGDVLVATVIEKASDGSVTVEFSGKHSLQEALDRIGETPLPRYIKRTNGESAADRERYQTVYAKNRGAIAAPTAGLHFTPEIFDRLKNRGAEIVEITLHVGYGTFESVKVEDLRAHQVMPERLEISDSVAECLTRAKQMRSRIVAIGTTTTRALESAFQENGEFRAGNGTAALTITPGYKFRAVDALLTNFHLPRSSLLVLTSTFGGYKLIMQSYKHAVEAEYRFYSYGDCMFIE